MFDVYSYLNGMTAGLHFIVCLVCGLQLCFDIFNGKKPDNISRLAGGIFLCWSCGAAFYIVSDLVPSLHWLVTVGSAIDYLALIGIAFGAYMLYANELPPRRTALVLAVPYVLMVAAFCFVSSSWREQLPNVAMVVLVVQYFHYYNAIRRHEKNLKDMYSDPDAHSLRWLWSVLGLCVGWWVARNIFILDRLEQWYSVALYIYMTSFVLFIFSKLCKYREPVSIETQVAIEQVKESDVGFTPEDTKLLQKTLIHLMEDKQIYLNPNLTVDNVVKVLDVDPNYFYAMMCNEMQTTFSQLINEYRVEHAKELLQNTDKNVPEVAELSGFNSVAVFHRVFITMTGKTPFEWRKKVTFPQK